MDWSFIHLSVANVVVIGLMLVVFVLAILLPFPGAAAREAAVAAAALRARDHPERRRRRRRRPSKSWTVKVRETGVEALPPERLLPDGQPTYVASWIYVFGVA